jgi:hypothetical protein
MRAMLILTLLIVAGGGCARHKAAGPTTAGPTAAGPTDAGPLTAQKPCKKKIPELKPGDEAHDPNDTFSINSMGSD